MGRDETGKRASHNDVNGVRRESMSFLELINLLLAHWKYLMIVFFSSAIVVAGLSLLMPNVYRGETLIAPAITDQAPGLNLSGIEGLASLAGIVMPTAGDVEEHLAILKSREFVWRFISDKNLMPLLFDDDWDASTDSWIEPDPEDQPSDWDAYRLFTRKILGVDKDAKNGLVRVSIEWYDPEVAADWVNEIVAMLNDHLRTIAIERSTRNLDYLNKELEGIQVTEMRETLYQLIEKEQRTAMLVNTQKEYAFRVLDPAVAPDRKVRPKRALFTLLAGMLGMLVAIVVLVVRHDYAKGNGNNDRRDDD
jgi:uncharacterized protein involved in exopolysaccharide biosynthesis